jgi:hypothetical protein
MRNPTDDVAAGVRLPNHSRPLQPPRRLTMALLKLLWSSLHDVSGAVPPCSPESSISIYR